MPYYNFENTKTQEQFTKEMKIAEKDQYLKDNPDIQQIFTSVNIVDPVGIGVKKPPADFLKNVVGRIQETTPKSVSNLDRTRWSIPKEI